MKKRRNAILGLFVSERSIMCAEVAGAAPAVVKRLGRFTLTDELNSSAPDDVGKALASFLAAHEFTAAQAVVGLPARSLLSQEKDLPPGDTSQLMAVLRMHAERMSMAGGSELVVDYAGEGAGVGGRALLVGVLKTQLERIGKMTAAAGLELIAVTPAALAVHAAANGGAGDAGLLMVGENGAELVLGPPASVRQLRHVSGMSGDAGAARLSSDLKRALSLAGSETGDKSIAAWSGTRLPVSVLSDQVGVTFTEPDLLGTLAGRVEPGALNGAAGGMTASAFVPAIAVAAASQKRGGLSINFLAPRLAASVKRRFGRQAILAATVGLAAIAGAVVFHHHVITREAEAEALSTDLKKRASDIKDAQAVLDRVAYGRTYFQARPPVMDAMREVTMAFGYNEPIWVNTFTLRDNGAGQIQGRAAQKDLALTLLDRLGKNPHLKDIKLLQVQDAGGKTREVVFSISFNYVGGN